MLNANRFYFTESVTSFQLVELFSLLNNIYSRNFILLFIYLFTALLCTSKGLEAKWEECLCMYTWVCACVCVRLVSAISLVYG